MTEIVDDRQRLVARLRDHATDLRDVAGQSDGGTARQFRSDADDADIAADLIERDGKLMQRLRFARPAGTTDPIWDELHNALASPSEGNKKGDEPVTLDPVVFGDLTTHGRNCPVGDRPEVDFDADCSCHLGYRRRWATADFPQRGASSMSALSEGERLDEFDENEWFDACGRIVPDLTREEFDKLWREFQAERERRAALSPSHRDT